MKSLILSNFAIKKGTKIASAPGIRTILFMYFLLIVCVKQLFISLVDKRDITEHGNHKQISVGGFHISTGERMNHRTYAPTEEYHNDCEDCSSPCSLPSQDCKQ